jgi:hypothetical protein
MIEHRPVPRAIVRARDIMRELMRAAATIWKRDHTEIIRPGPDSIAWRPDQVPPDHRIARPDPSGPDTPEKRAAFLNQFAGPRSDPFYRRR